MTDELIIQQLKDKEAQLLNELNKVRLALQAFINDNINFGNLNFQKQAINDQIPATYTPDLTYAAKILFVLANEGKPLLVDDIANAIHALEPEIEPSRLHKNVSYNLSMLAKYSKIKKHPFNRRIKYSL
jgi:hypothetical protein